jgi:hypothetical protein
MPVLFVQHKNRQEFQRIVYSFVFAYGETPAIKKEIHFRKEIIKFNHSCGKYI